MRLGDLDALFRTIKNSDWLPHERIEAMKMVRYAPTIDAVHVVRCKDCKHWRPIHEHIPHMECNIFCGAYDHGYPTNADDYCSYAERKDGTDVKDT